MEFHGLFYFYSMARALYQKLGIKEGMNLYLISAPDHYKDLIGGISEDIKFSGSASEVDFIHLFARDKKTLIKGIFDGKKRMHAQSIFWISWPKQSGNIPSQINREDVREQGLSHGLVDIKVASVDENWSGLKFVIPLKDR